MTAGATEAVLLQVLRDLADLTGQEPRRLLTLVRAPASAGEGGIWLY